jgi:transcriptional regulator with XRE-family HTH domain
VEQDAIDGLDDQCDYRGVDRADYQAVMNYDLPSLVAATRLNVDAVSQLSGLNASLMSQYLSGKKKPSVKQQKRIEQGIHRYAETLSRFSF